MEFRFHVWDLNPGPKSKFERTLLNLNPQFSRTRWLLLPSGLLCFWNAEWGYKKRWCQVRSGRNAKHMYLAKQVLLCSLLAMVKYLTLLKALGWWHSQIASFYLLWGRLQHCCIQEQSAQPCFAKTEWLALNTQGRSWRTLSKQTNFNRILKLLEIYCCQKKILWKVTKFCSMTHYLLTVGVGK